MQTFSWIGWSCILTVASVQGRNRRRPKQKLSMQFHKIILSDLWGQNSWRWGKRWHEFFLLLHNLLCKAIKQRESSGQIILKCWQHSRVICWSEAKRPYDIWKAFRPKLFLGSCLRYLSMSGWGQKIQPCTTRSEKSASVQFLQSKGSWRIGIRFYGVSQTVYKSSRRRSILPKLYSWRLHDRSRFHGQLVAFADASRMWAYRIETGIFLDET